MVALRNAPVIVTRFTLASQKAIISAAAGRIRSTWRAAPPEGEAVEGIPDDMRLRKLDGDIWALNDSAVGFHKDKTAPRHRVIGVILVNDAGLMLYQDQMVWDIPVGTVFHIDGRRTHGAIERNGNSEGLFGFLAWDVPYNSNLEELLKDLLPSLEAYANGEKRINILKLD